MKLVPRIKLLLAKQVAILYARPLLSPAGKWRTGSTDKILQQGASRTLAAYHPRLVLVNFPTKKLDKTDGTLFGKRICLHVSFSNRKPHNDLLPVP